MNKVMFHCDWGSSSADLLNTYKLHTQNESGIWKNVQGTSDMSEADYHVVMDGGVPDVPLSKVLYFQREEPEIKEPKLDWPDDLFFQGTFTDRKHYFIPTWRIIKSYDFLKNLKYDRNAKKHMLSSITSGKVSATGHKFRVGFLMNLVEQTKNIHVFGRYGIEKYGNISSCYKGTLSNVTHGDGIPCKFDGLNPYHYTITFENSSCYNCVSEKAVDALISWSMPIYWGCPNISDYLPEGSYHHITDPTDPASVDRVLEIIKNPPSDENIKAMTEARELILDKYNLWAQINTIITEAK